MRKLLNIYLFLKYRYITISQEFFNDRRKKLRDRERQEATYLIAFANHVCE
jgi:hypothetical protein